MLQNYSLPIKEIRYSEKNNSMVQVIYEDNSYNFTEPDDTVVLSWATQNDILEFIELPSSRDASLPEANLVSEITGQPAFVVEE